MVLPKLRFLILLVLSSCCLYSSQNQNRSSVNAAALTALIDRAKATHSDAVIILHNGAVIAEYCPQGKPPMIHAMSVTKSIVSLAFGLLQTQGFLPSLDVPVYTFFPEWKQSSKKNITLKHILNHTSGLQDQRSALAVYQSPDFLQFALVANVAHEPGTHFFYSNKAVNILPGIVKKITGMPIDQYVNQKLFQPLGIHQFKWERDQAGNVHGLAGLHLYPRDLATIGQMILNQGLWKNKKIIDPSWLKTSFTPQEHNKISGLLWWLIPQSTTYIIDDAQIEKLRQAGLKEEFIKNVERLKGSYPTENLYEQKIEELFGTDYKDIFDKELKEGVELSRKVYGPIIGYKAWGYLGQYLIIYPEKNLVGVRMISSDSHGEEGDANDFNDFDKMLYQVVN
jgi:CubicO group peptidase (beta-lactamase class C family)